MKKLLFLILFSVISYSQGIKITALAESPTVSSGDLFVIVTDPSGSPVTKKVTAENLADSMMVWVKAGLIVSDPFTRRMNDETPRILIPQFEAPFFDWQTDYNNGMDKIDSAVKYFDPLYFEVNGDTITATDGWNLIPTNIYPILDSVYNNSGTASTSSSIYRAIERAKALKLSLTGGTLTGTLTGTTIDATTGFTLNGTSLNTTGTLTNVAYKGQNNNFTVGQTIATSITTPKIIGGTATTSDLYLQTTSGVGASGADMHFLTGNNGGTEAMTILNNGYVGVNTSSPQRRLHIVEGTAGALPTLGSQLIILQSNATTSTNSGIGILWGTAGTSFFHFGDSDNFSQGVLGYNNNGDYMFFSTGGSERGRSTSTGLNVTGSVEASATVTSTQFKLSALNTAPASVTDTGTTGEIRITATAIFICIATNTWVKANLATW